MGNCCQSNNDCEPGVANSVSVSAINYDANKDKTFVIVGAGPAGIHMGHLLSKKGYKNVIILEKSPESHGPIGKTFTIEDSEINNNINTYGKDDKGNDMSIFHELGTCYLHPEYFVVKDLLKEYDPDNKELGIPSRAVFFDEDDEVAGSSNRKYNDGMSFSQWALSEAEHRAYPKEWHWLPDVITGGAAFADSVIRYNKLHEEIFGQQDCNRKHGFLPKPANFDKTKELFNMTFLEFLEKNKFYGLIPTFLYSQSIQGYGTLDIVPAYYGLFWNTPELLKQVIDIVRAFNKEPNVTCLSKGFTSLWTNIINKCKLNIMYDINIKSINRFLGNSDKPMEINYNNGSNNETLTLKCDYLFFACGMHNNVNLLNDATEDEIDVWKCMTAHTLAATLYESDILEESKHSTSAEDEDNNNGGKGIFAASQIWPNKIWNAYEGQLYARRNSAKCLLGSKRYAKLVKDGSIKKDRFVGYQFLAREPKESDKEELLNTFKENLERAGCKGCNIIKQEVWEYFPIWNQDGINKGYPWYVKNEMQGKYKNTFYIGSSVCFESVLSVIEYNNELDSKFAF